MNTRTLDRRQPGAAAASAAAATAALACAQASHGRRAGLVDAIGAALDDARPHLPGLAAADAGIAADAALRQHDTLRGWLHALSAALRRAELAALAPAAEAVRTVPLGPVAAVGPHATAYGMAGVHVMAALAAGCPVLAAGCATQPGAAVLADLIGGAVAACGLPAATFTLLPDATTDVSALLGHHALRAAISRAGAVTVAHPAGLMLLAEADGCEAAFILPGALNGRAEHLGQLLLAHGGPGVLVAAVAGPGYVDLRETIVDTATDHCFAEISCAKVLAQPARAARGGRLLVRCAAPAELLALAAALGPQHCASLHLGPADAALATNLLPALELMARHIHINRIGGALLPSLAGAVDAIGRFRRPVFHHPA